MKKFIIILVLIFSSTQTSNAAIHRREKTTKTIDPAERGISVVYHIDDFNRITSGKLIN